MKTTGVALALLLVSAVLAGCTEISNLSESSPTGNVPADADDVGKTIEDTEEWVAVTVDTLEDVRRSLPEDEQEQKLFVNDTAASICAATEPLELDNLDEQTEFTDDQLRRLEDAAEILDENFQADIDPHHLSALSKHAGTATKFLPIIASYNKVARTSCKVSVDDEKSLEDFYVATGQFAVGVVLLQQQTMYHAAFRSTRIINHRLSFVTIRKVCGNRCHAALMSEVHWATRDNLWDVTNTAVASLVRQEDFNQTIQTAIQTGEVIYADAEQTGEQARDNAEQWLESEDGQQAQETVDESVDKASSFLNDFAQ